MPKDRTSIIKVIGVGGGGSNAVNHMFRQGIKGVEFIVCNTDAQALDISPVPHKIQLGTSLTEGRGAGSMAEVGRNAAIENIEDIRKVLSHNTKMVFITAGMGGGTGTGAAPVIAQTAREMGILTVGIVTVPFNFEGPKRIRQAEEGIENMKKNVDTLLVICNEKLREMHGNQTISQAFTQADNVLTIASKGIAEIITVTGYVNVDFEDVKTVMTNSGVAIMGSAIASGEDRAISAVEQALNSPLLNDNNIRGAKYILMNIASGTSEVTMDEISEITDYIQKESGMTADIIWGNCVDEGLEDKLSVTLIATGFKTKHELDEEERKTKVYLPFDKSQLHHSTEESNVTKEVHAPVKEMTVSVKEPKQEVQAEQQTEISEARKFEFDIKQKAETQTVKTEEQPKNINPQMTKRTVEPTAQASASQPVQADEEQQRKARERVERLKEVSVKFPSTNVYDMENTPAFIRKNVQLNPVPHSSENNVSRYTLGTDAENKPELKSTNSFLHDNVD
ncbi:MAG: cell division protein FtsZ [Bacteroidia bacterium]|nr:cell division protein FtsZ [Bacteroidia bacterium]